jgi:transposase
MNQMKRQITLPPEVRAKILTIKDGDERNEYVRKLRAMGWTLQSIANACGISRERIRQIIEMKSPGLELGDDYIIPTPPFHPEKIKREYVEPSDEILTRLLELQPLAQQVRSHSPRYRAEAEEYTRLLNQAHSVDGVTLYRLAKRLGVSHGAIRFRLARYGYKPAPNATSKVYKPINSKNRVA